MDKNHDPSFLIAAFETGTIDPSTFDHRQHITVAYHLLEENEFLLALERYTSGLRAIVKKADVPGKFNTTVTIALMSLIAERMDAKTYESADAFLNDNADLMNRNLLTQWYSEARLSSELAKRQYLMPDRVA